MKVNVLIEMFQGIVTDVFLFQDAKDAEKKFREITGMEFTEYMTRKVTEDADDILGKLAGTTIYETDVVWSTRCIERRENDVEGGCHGDCEVCDLPTPLEHLMSKQ